MISVIPAIWLVTLGGEYKAEQNRCRELGVLPKFHSKAFLKIREYPTADEFKARNDFVVFKQRDLLWSGLLYLTFCTLKAMFTTTEENEVALSLFYDFGIFSHDQFCL